MNKLDMDFFDKEPLVAVVRGMGFKDPSEAAEKIFKLALEDANWIEKIETPVTNGEYSSKEEDMVKSLEVDKLGITDVDGVYHKVAWWNYQGAFYQIASCPDYFWVAEDLVGKRGRDQIFAANCFMQIMLYDEIVYFG